MEQQNQKLLLETQLDVTEFDNLLQPIIDTCTKDAISVSTPQWRSWRRAWKQKTPWWKCVFLSGWEELDVHQRQVSTALWTDGITSLQPHHCGWGTFWAPPTPHLLNQWRPASLVSKALMFPLRSDHVTLFSAVSSLGLDKNLKVLVWAQKNWFLVGVHR